MVYGTASITSATPAKDLMAALKTPLVAGGLQFVESYGSPAVATYRSVAYGNGTFVTIAQNTSTAATSPDGVTWTPRIMPVSTSWQAVAYGNGVFVALSGTSTAATSPDGINWTQRDMPVSAGWSTVTYGGGTFVAIAASSTIAATSPDGITWTQRTMNVSANWQTVAYGNSRFVVSATNSSQVSTSPDGITWTSSAFPVAGGAVAYGAGLFVIPSYTGTTTYTSPDAGVWTSRVMPSPGAGNWQSVAYGGSQFVAITQNANIAASSPDGITWTQRALPISAAWQTVAYGNGVFVAVAQSSAIAATSTDGITWTSRNLTGTSSSPTADVYKSPAASNQFGADWYLILRRASDANNAMYYQVAEGYNPTTHLASYYGGTGISVVPVPGNYTNSMSPAAPDLTATIPSAANVSLTIGTLFTYWYSINANRVIVGVKTSTETGFYAGLYDDLLPTGVTQFPLVCAKFPTTQFVGIAIANGTAVGAGGFTREPGQTLAAATNFEAAIHNGMSFPSSVVLPGNYTPGTTTGALYGNIGGISRVMVGSTRSTASATNDAVRGLLIGCVNSSVFSIIGDTITAGGKFYTRVAGPTTTYGYFVDQAL